MIHVLLNSLLLQDSDAKELFHLFSSLKVRQLPGRGVLPSRGGYSPIWAIRGCAAG